MITIQNVFKNFSGHCVLNDISLEIKSGEIVGFLGLNGAGKTTLMRILTGFLSASKGEVNVAGFDIGRDPEAVKKNIGYLPENPPLYLPMRVADYLTYAARLRGLGPRAIPDRIEQVLTECSLADVRHQTIGTLSKGYRQRVGIAQAIVHNPPVLILDEPTDGLDPRQIQQVRNLIKNVEQKRTVIISTHILSEIEAIAHRVIILHNGRIAADMAMDKLLQNENKSRRQRRLEETFLKVTA